MLSKTLGSIMTTAVLALGFATASQAGPTAPAYTFNSFGSPGHGNYYIGIEINVTTPYQVTALGAIASTGVSTLAHNIGVGIYSVAPGGTNPKPATPVVTAIIPTGTAAESVGAVNAFFTSVTPVTLSAGNYVVMADNGTTDVAFGNNASYDFLPGISYVNGWFGGSNFPGMNTGFTVTNQANGSGAWPAAVFKVATAEMVATPEPATVVNLGIAAVAGLGVLWRRRSRSAT